MRRRIRLNESDIHRIVRKSVNRILRESSKNMDEFMVDRLTQCLTDLDEGTARMWATEICNGCPDVARFIIEYSDGYGYGGQSLDDMYDDYVGDAM